MVTDWIAARECGRGAFGVCIDAPCGFAVPGSAQRNTEAQGIGTFPTPSLDVFLRDFAAWSADKNHTPLRQKVFWKLIGQVAFRYFVTLTTGQQFDMPFSGNAGCRAGA